LKQILDNSDPDELRQRATPRNRTEPNQTTVNRIKAYAASDYTIAEIAEILKVSPSTVSKYL
jgi:Mn-dependent DtxR family transcriptional regulator